MTDQNADNRPLTGNDGQPVTGSDKPTPPAVSYSDKTPLSEFPPEAQEYVKRLRKEIEDKRKATEREQEKLLQDQQKWKELAETREAKLNQLQPILDQHDSIEAAFNASLDTRLKQIPDDIRKKTIDPIRAALSPVDFSNWLDANADVFRNRRAPPMDEGAGGPSGGGKGGVGLSQQDLEMAQAMGIKSEVWAKRKAEMEKSRASPQE